MTATGTTEFHYDAFISYRHGGLDQEIAEALHRRLETYRTPTRLVRAGSPVGLARVFRDRDELPTSSDLSASIVKALHASRFLIVICSPRTRESHWISKEIEIFQATGRTENILTLLIDGEPDAALPEALISERSFVINGADGVTETVTHRGEPLAADIRAGSSAESRRLLGTESLRLLAPILGCSYADLRQRHLERARRRLQTLVVGVAAMVLVFAGLSAFALVQRNLAEQAQRRAERALTDAEAARHDEELARKLAVEQRVAAEKAKTEALEQRASARASQAGMMALTASNLTSDGRADLAVQVSLEALLGSDPADPPPYVSEARDALREALRHDHLALRLRTGAGSVADIALDGAGRRVLVVFEGGRAELRDIKTNDLRLSLHSDASDPYERAWFAPSGKRFAIARRSGKIELFSDVAQGPPLTLKGAGSVDDLVFDVSGNIFVAAQASGGEDLASFDAGGALLHRYSEQALDWALSRDGARLVVHDASGVQILETRSGVTLASIELDGFSDSPLEALAIDRTGSLIAFAETTYHPVTIYDVVQQKVVQTFLGDQYRIDAIAFDPVTRDYGAVILTSGDNGSAAWLFNEGQISSVRQIEGGLQFLPSGQVVETSADAKGTGLLRVLDMRPADRGGYGYDEILRAAIEDEPHIFSDPDGVYIAIVTADGAAVYRLAPPDVAVARTDMSLLPEMAAASADGHTVLVINDLGSEAVANLLAPQTLDVVGTLALDDEGEPNVVSPDYEQAAEPYAGPTSDLAVSDGGRRFAYRTGLGDKVVRNLEDGGIITTIPAAVDSSNVQFVGDRPIVAIRDSDAVIVEDAETTSPVARIPLDASQVGQLWLPPDASFAIFAEGHTIYRADATSGATFKELLTLSNTDLGDLFPGVADTQATWSFAASKGVLCATLSFEQDTAGALWRFDLSDSAPSDPFQDIVIENLHSAGGQCFATYSGLLLALVDEDGIERGSDYKLLSNLDFQHHLPILLPLADGGRLLYVDESGDGERQTVRVLRTANSKEALIAWAGETHRECLTQDERSLAGLNVEAPQWCETQP